MSPSSTIELEKEVRQRLERKAQLGWERQVSGVRIDEWLRNFDGRVLGVEKDRLLALYLLSKYVHLDEAEVKCLLRQMYRGFLRNMLSDSKSNGGDRTIEINKILRSTRFYCLGNPSESGWHLLYFFRQVNNIGPELFYDPLISGEPFESLCLVDDVSITGDQAKLYSGKAMKIDCRKRFFLLMVTTEQAKKKLEDSGFIVISPIILKKEELHLGRNSPIMSDLIEVDNLFSKEDIERFLRVYGALASNKFPLGYGQFMIAVGLHHNVPDDTLPIFWADDNWIPIFRRHHKLKGVPNDPRPYV